MSRASRRSRRSYPPKAVARANPPAATKAPVAAPRARPAPAARPPKADLKDQFRHLGRDVRRTFAVAGICLAVVIAAWLVFR